MTRASSACDAGDASALDKLGQMYRDGDPLDEDDAKAASYYGRGADAGDAEGMTTLGVLYFNGEGVKANQATALGWWQKAAGLGYADAESSGAMMN